MKYRWIYKFINEFISFSKISFEFDKKQNFRLTFDEKNWFNNLSDDWLIIIIVSWNPMMKKESMRFSYEYLSIIIYSEQFILS